MREYIEQPDEDELPDPNPNSPFAYIHFQIYAQGSKTKLRAFQQALEYTINRFHSSLDITVKDITAPTTRPHKTTKQHNNT